MCIQHIDYSYAQGEIISRARQKRHLKPKKTFFMHTNYKCDKIYDLQVNKIVRTTLLENGLPI